MKAKLFVLTLICIFKELMSCLKWHLVVRPETARSFTALFYLFITQLLNPISYLGLGFKYNLIH